MNVFVYQILASNTYRTKSDTKIINLKYQLGHEMK